MIATTEFKKGAKILFEKQPYMILEYHHVKPGKGGAFLRTKMKNLITNLVKEETFRSGEKFEQPDLAYKNMAYLYEEDGLYHFMDQDSYEEVVFNRETIQESLDYLKEQAIFSILYFDQKPISVQPPMFMELTVAQTPPGVKGDTAQGAGSKPATLETGLVVQVPLFVTEGDILKIDTREGIYIERIKR